MIFPTPEYGEVAINTKLGKSRMRAVSNSLSLTGISSGIVRDPMKLNTKELKARIRKGIPRINISRKTDLALALAFTIHITFDLFD